MQSDDPSQRARPDPLARQEQQQPPPGGSGQGAASACARMKMLREDQDGQHPVEPDPDTVPP